MSSRLPRQVKLLGAVSLLNDFASEMIYPLLPAFLTGVLGAGPQALGALDGAAELAAAFVKVAAGRLADRVPLRGPLIVRGYFTAVVARPVIAGTRAPAEGSALAVGGRAGAGRAAMGGKGRHRALRCPLPPRPPLPPLPPSSPSPPSISSACPTR